MSQLLQYYNSFSQRAPAASSVTAPTFEDLSIDDTLTELQRLVRYTKSSIGLQRLVHTKMLADVAKTVGFEDTMMFILPLLDDLSHDNEPAIKQQLVEQLGPLAKLLSDHGGEKGYKALLDVILPLTTVLLEDSKGEVRASAAATLVKISLLVRKEDLGQYVLTIVLCLAHEDNKEEMRMTAAQLLNLLAECLGQDLCKQFIIPEVVSLAEDPVFRVRKSTALNFHNICRIGGENELFERLMPAFVRLSKDDMYRVRRACAESVFAISEHVSDDIRVGVLVEIFLRFAQDPARLVKQSILQQSGMFISTLPARVVNETILGNYISMANEPIGDVAVDAELKHYCAYSFPAVLQTITGARWGEVRELYHSLVQCRLPNVRQSLASSLHEIARILGDVRIVEEELVPVFEELIQDVEVVQLGVMRHLAKFLGYLSEPCRISYLPEMHNVLHATNPFNWRLRQCLALQLPVLLDLPPPGSIYVTLFPLVMTLLQDPVASVRKDSFGGVAKMLLLLYNLAEQDHGSSEDVRWHEAHFDSVIRAVNGLALGDKFQPRQLWAELSLVLLKVLPKEIFEKYFLDAILLLVMDPVINVRVAIAKLLTGWAPEYKAPWNEANEVENESESAPDAPAATAEDESEAADAAAGSVKHHEKSPWGWLLDREDIQECVHRMKREDNDVHECIQQLAPRFPELQMQAISCRGLRSAPGGEELIPNCYTGKMGHEAFIKRFGNDNDDTSTTTSEVSSVDLEPVSMDGDRARSLSNSYVPSGGTNVFEGEEDVCSLPKRSNSPTLEEAMLMEEHILLTDMLVEDRGSRLEEEENQSEDPEFMPISEKTESQSSFSLQEIQELEYTKEG